jgi:RNA polymerase sigma-70 factor (ECF subfamily)
MTEIDWLAERFEEQRPRLRGVAYRMLGSLADADDAVQETWIRLARSDVDAVENLNAWLTTVVGRVSLNMLRSRRVRREDSLDVHVPDPVVGPPDAMSPEDDALVADSVGLALLVVLDTLGPAERLAFVLHDVFAIPFDEIAPMVDRSPAATRQLASRARRRIQDTAASPDVGMSAQRAVVDAFFAAGRSGSFEALVALLHPDAVLRADFGAGAPEHPSPTVGAAAIASGAVMYGNVGREPRPATVNGAAGAVIVADGKVVSVMAFTVVGGRVAAIDVLADPDRLARLDFSFLDLEGDMG